MDTSKLVLYDYQWQELRVSLDFSNAESTERSLRVLRGYLREHYDLNRVWRILNLLSATRMGFSGIRKLIKSADKLKDLEVRDKSVLAEREFLSQSHQRMIKRGDKFQLNSEEKLISDLKDAQERSLDTFMKVYNSLSDRYEKSNRSKNRPELKYYLNLMEKVMHKEVLS
jgi:hypothetical protein